MQALDADAVVSGLGLDDELGAWVSELGQGDPIPAKMSLPEHDAGREMLARLNVADEDAAEPLATLDAVRAAPELWWLLERCHHRVLSHLGQVPRPRECWPQLPAHLGASGRSFYVHVYLSVLPDTLAWHRRMAVPEPVSWATLADLGRHMAIQRRLHGTTGVDEPWWMMLHLRGELFECGRLQYDRHLLGQPSEVAWYAEQ